MSTIKYRPEIDGLRALAIVPVIVFHFNPEWLSGGFMGVDVFFVISGYLITSIILAELAAGTFTFLGFWERRVRRIFPALGFMLLGVLLFAFAVFCPTGLLSTLGRQTFKVISFVSNHYMLLITGDYWGQSASLIPLLHTWSLAVEEQFYFFLPTLIFLIFRWWDKSWILPVLCILALGSFAYCVSQTAVNQSAAFFLLSSRAWELLAGSVLAILAPRIVVKSEANAQKWLADLGLVIILGGYFFLSEVDFPGWKAAIPVVGTAMFIGFSQRGGHSTWLLQTRPLVFIGKASYSLYLWHWPALVFGKLFADLFEMPSLLWWALLISIAIAIGSYLWIEKLGKQIKAIWRWAGISVAIIIAVALLAAFNHRDLTPAGIAQTEYKGGMYESVYANVSLLRKNQNQNLGIQYYLPDSRATPDHSGFKPKITNPELSQDIIVLGDSHALMWGSVIERIAQKSKAGCQFWTVSGAPPFLDASPIPRANLDSAQRAEFNRQKMQSVERNCPKVIIVTTRLDSKWDTESKKQSLHEIENLVSRIHELSPKSSIVIIRQPPMLATGDQNAVMWLAWRNRFIKEDTVSVLNSENWVQADNYIKKLTEKFNYVHMVGVADLYLSSANRVTLVRDRHVVYIDDNHLSEYGASLAESRIQAAVEPLLQNKQPPLN